jgi:hypothetical protein
MTERLLHDAAVLRDAHFVRSSEAVTFFDCCRFGSLILLDGKRECESWRNYLMILQKAV